MKPSIVEVLPTPVFRVVMALRLPETVLVRYAVGVPFERAVEMARDAASLGFRSIVVDANGVVAYRSAPEARRVVDTFGTASDEALS